ncbi:OmpA family protein [Spongiivirga citrea]|uniref:OmpA family protein n=1 Tax=Spongiivirga citrea TaxID=1481457 RepID=A0A6M0CUD9_9FLAO|nr:OmpA family protein [Spongiivirga citrea]NER19117.1 OmpA family protein [Spongiivirga citrea]
MSFKFRVLTLLLFLSVSFVASQNKAIDRGNASFDKQAYANAITYYEAAIKQGAKSAEVYRKLADSYYNLSNLPKASENYKLLFETQKPTDTEVYFRYAQSLKAVENYKESDRIMNEFMFKKQEDTRGKRFSTSRNYLDSIKTNMMLYDIKNSRYNSRASDFAPTLLDGELVFSSSRDSGTYSRFRAKWNNEAFLDIYKTVNNKDTLSKKSVPFDKRMNTKFHESTSVFTKDGNTMYFTRNDFSGGRRGQDRTRTTRLKIYRSQKTGKGWSKPKELPFNDRDYSVAHPALNADETKLYFASDMPGTLGASDIWMVDINGDGSFGEPVNLGPSINTESKETFPYISSENNLYFASDGHVGLGGLDIFVSKVLEDNNFGEVINVGKPINGPTDDFTFVIDEESRIGYFASNRKGGVGSDDIYLFKLRPKTIEELEQLVMGLVTDADTNEKIVGAKVTILDQDLQVKKDTLTDDLGIFELKLSQKDLKDGSVESTIRAESEGYVPNEETFLRTREIDTFFINIQLRKVGVPGDPEDPNNKNVTINVGADGNPVVATNPDTTPNNPPSTQPTTPVVTTEPSIGEDLAKVLQLKPIYFNFDKSNIRYDAKLELDKIVEVMKQYPQVIIDVRSHTDSRGRDIYNMALSNRRANATVAYLTKKGISPERITGKGYGESTLVTNCPNGVRCTAHQHQLNRRSEFIVVRNTSGSAIVKSSTVIDPDRLRSTKPAALSGTFVNYDFSSENKKVVYTVQVSALRSSAQSRKYNRLTDLFNHQYDDGFNRYFSGIFATPTEARNHMKRLRTRGFDGAFVVGLQGEIRF